MVFNGRKPGKVRALGLALIIFGCGVRGLGQTELDAKWERFDFSHNLVQLAQVQALPLSQLKLLRGIVFGRHGRIFKDDDIQGYLVQASWYRPDDHFSNSSLNATERKNLDLIRAAESAKHDKIEPGDLRFHETRAFTLDQVGKHSLAELRVMRAEIEAIHGKRFDDEPWLQTYFEERYWYQPARKYDPAQLSEVERKNLATMVAAEKDVRNIKVSLGDMVLFQSKPLTEDLLAGLGLYELRLMRNEVYALRGKRFKTGWIQDYFDGQDWYNAPPDSSEPQLSEIEKQNVLVILHYEDKLHEDLSSNAVSPELLQGLFLEDARKLRNEIFARHGRTFKDRWLQQYFNSLSWYKPDPNFKDSSLSEMERRNVATILKYEGQAESLMKRVEG
jgi:hypothetical protein